MKRPESLTRDQKEIVCANGIFPPDNWMLEGESEFYLWIIHRITHTRRRIDRYAIAKNAARWQGVVGKTE